MTPFPERLDLDHPDPASALQIRQERIEDGPWIDHLLTEAFGPGRFAKTAERLREGNQQILHASFVALLDHEPIGSVRLWPCWVHEKGKDAVPLAFLGPIAVKKGVRRGGIGGALVRHAMDVLRATDQTLSGAFLVGDPPYFSRFGFVPAPGLILPGPVDTHRVMVCPFFADTPLRGRVVKAPGFLA